MAERENFREFYDTQLLPELKNLDKERKTTLKRVFIIVAVFLAVIIAIGSLLPQSYSQWKTPAIFITAVIGFIVISISGKNYRHNFKTKIISRIAKFIDESLNFNPAGSVPRSEFIRSEIFQQSCDQYRGEDHVSGKIGKTQIEFSEVVAKYRSTTGSGKNRRTKYVTYFKGIFFIADFNKNFSTQTFVLPDFAEKTFGKLGQKFQAMNFTRAKLIRLENPEFEKEFVVYGDDQVEARYILSPALMERILNYKRRWNSRVYLAFVDSKLYIALWMNKNLFETRLLRSIVDYSFIEENMNYLQLLVNVVDDLNLNTRIWSKQ